MTEGNGGGGGVFGTGSAEIALHDSELLQNDANEGEWCRGELATISFRRLQAAGS